MLDTFKARLKAKAKTLGAASLSNARIDAIAARLHKKYPELTDEADHDTRIDEFNELQPLADIAKEDDRVRTLEAKAKGQPSNQNQDVDDDNVDEPQPSTSKPKKKDTEEIPAWAKGLIDAVNTITKEKTQTSMAAKVAEKLKDVVPAKFYAGRLLPEKEEDLEAFVETVKADHTSFMQDMINEGLMSATPPLSGGGPGKLDDKAFEAQVEAFVAEKKGATSSSTTK